MEQAMAVNWAVTLGKHYFRFNDYSKYQLKTSDWGAPLGQDAQTRCLRPAHPGGALVYGCHPDWPMVRLRCR